MSDELSKELGLLRDRIDEVDETILTLMNERAVCAKKVAEVKVLINQDDISFYRPDRESSVMRRLTEKNSGPLLNDMVLLLFRELMSACLSLEKPLTVATLGPEGSFSEMAAIKHFGSSAQLSFSSSIANVFDAVLSEEVQVGLVPIENSTEGLVNISLDSLLKTGLKIIGEVELDIDLCLLIHPEAEIEDIQTVYAHEQALAQSRSWLSNRSWKTVSVNSNSEAAVLASQSKTVAAVASKAVLKHYDLKVAFSSIQDSVKNRTRFLSIATEREILPTGKDKTTFCIFLPDYPGALFEVLKCFSMFGINLSRINSRPVKDGSWSYLFFIDIVGHVKDSMVEKALESLSKLNIKFVSMGSYPETVFIK